jgi:hypothetical protein
MDKMRTRFTTCFGVLGYLSVLWHYRILYFPLHSPLTSHLLEGACVRCPPFDPTTPVVVPLFFAGPAEAIIYGILGLLIGLALEKVIAKARKKRVAKSFVF